jgi:hypothetical protein
MNPALSTVPRRSFLPLSRNEFARLSPQERVCYLTLALRTVTAKVDEVLREHDDAGFVEFQ